MHTLTKTSIIASHSDKRIVNLSPLYTWDVTGCCFASPVFFQVHVPFVSCPSGFLHLFSSAHFLFPSSYLTLFLSSVSSQRQSGEEQAGSREFGHNTSGPVPVGVLPWSGVYVCAYKWHVPSTGHIICITVKTCGKKKHVRTHVGDTNVYFQNTLYVECCFSKSKVFMPKTFLWCLMWNQCVCSTSYDATCREV